MDGTIVIEHEFQALPPLSLLSHSSVAGPWENIVDRDMDASYFFILNTCYSRNRLICEKLVSPVCIRGAYPTLANP